MLVYPCEPRGRAWQRYSPFFRGFCVWLYREFVRQRIFGWEHAFIVLSAVFPEESQPDEGTIVGWYRDNPDYPEKLHSIGSPQPAEYFQEWCTLHPDEVRKFRELALLKMKTQSRSGGLQPHEYPGQPTKTAVPIYCPQGQPLACWISSPACAQQPNNILIERLFGVMCQTMLLAMVGWFARQCAKIAVS